MWMSKERAMAMREGRKRFFSIYEGRAVCIMPFGGDRARYVGVHYVEAERRSYLCPGPATCPRHHIREVAKAHIPALVYKRWEPYKNRDGAGVPPKVEYSPEMWETKIVELTEHSLPAYEDTRPEGTMAIIARSPGRKTNKVEFHWLDSQLINYPNMPLNVEELLPAIIRGAYYPTAEVVALDNSESGAIKHKI